MTMETSRKKGPFARLGTLILGIVTGLIALMVFAHTAKVGLGNRIATLATGRTLRVDTSAPAIISKIQRLQRLETVTYTMDKIIEGDRQSTVLPDFLVGDRLLLVVHGETIAGVDLAALKPENISVHDRDVTVHLPEAQIFVTRLDSSRTRVFSRITGLFVSADPNLESQVRAKAEQQLREEAASGGILNTARQNAASTVSNLLLELGFEHVQVN